MMQAEVLNILCGLSWHLLSCYLLEIGMPQGDAGV